VLKSTVKLGEKPPHGDTDWARLNAMIDEEAVAAALCDPMRMSKSPNPTKRAKTRTPGARLRAFG